MKNKNSSGKLASASIFAAIAASLCCITPVLALLAGTSGFASTFTWLDPARPYLIGLTVAVLGFAWYQKLKPQKADAIDCACDEDEKKPFLQSKGFLGIVTVFAAVMLAFPNYAHIFYPDNSKEVVIVNESNIKTAAFDIKGMTCSGCEEHVKHAVNELQGIVKVSADFHEGKAEVKFDASKTDLEKIKEAIDGTGYKVTDFKLAQQ